MDIERLKKRKKELGWTLDEIAEKSGISRRTVSRLFSGNPDYPSPTYNTVQAIERALGLSEEGYKDTMPFEVTPIEEEVIQTFRTISDEDKQLFLILMKKIK